MAFLPATGGIIQALSDTTELVELYKPLGLYLKPTARLNISVKLPLLKDPGQAISNWDLMERIKKLIHPLHFSSIKVSKSTMEFVRFEAEVSNRETLAKVVKIIDSATLKVIGFYETLKVRAAEAKSDFPQRHDWDIFFRDAKNMNELHPGERPDTIYLAYLPCKWFLDPRHNRDVVPKEKQLPSEFVVRRIFETFGEVRCVDIPMTDSYRPQMSRTGMRCTGFRFGGEVTFEGYVQFNEYISFVKAMDALRNMKLVHIDDDGKASAASIKVDFDKSKHLSDKSIRRRRLERERLARIDNERKAREAAEKAKLEAELAEVKKVKTDRRRHREEKRRIKHLEKKRFEEEREIERKILFEERKLVVAERKLESMRLLAELFERVKEVKQKEEVERQEKDLEEALITQEAEKEKLKAQEVKARERLLKKHEKNLRKKVTKKYKDQEEKQEEYRREEKRKRIHPSDLQSVASSFSYSQRPRYDYQADYRTGYYYDRPYEEYPAHGSQYEQRSRHPSNHGYAGWKGLDEEWKEPDERMKERRRPTEEWKEPDERMKERRRPALPPKDYSDRWMDVLKAAPEPKVGYRTEEPRRDDYVPKKQQKVVTRKEKDYSQERTLRMDRAVTLEYEDEGRNREDFEKELDEYKNLRRNVRYY